MQSTCLLICIFNILNQVSSLTKLQERSKFNVEDFKMDLDNLKPNEGSGGGQIRALTVQQMPALQDEHISFTLVDMNPCAVNLPHTHPRASEIIYVISGDILAVGFVEENGGRGAILNELHVGEVTIFPKGLVHFQQNLGCKSLRFLAALSSEDPGVITLNKAEFSFPGQVLEATFKLGKADIQSIKTMLPSSLAPGNDECLKRCKMI